ncbi:MAG TPA: hypothetical protein VHG32_14880 [Thermoanaerobaculia bacterium]|nr:hypothetical protein [Thermoanaerobaculia bacterium]
MKWKELRSQFPHQWLVVEALDARSEHGKRLLEELAVVDRYPDGESAMRAYLRLHRLAPERELYVLHTDRDALEITEQRWLGIRAAG